MTPCIEYWGRRNPKGYGQRKYNGSNHLSHRVAYAVSKGLSMQDIQGRQICHTCDNPPCVNPEHLFLGTQDDNSADMVRKDRQSKGEHRPQSRLKDAVVQEARELVGAGASQASVARYFNVDPSTISRAVRGETWRHV